MKKTVSFYDIDNDKAHEFYMYLLDNYYKIEVSNNYLLPIEIIKHIYKKYNSRNKNRNDRIT